MSAVASLCRSRSLRALRICFPSRRNKNPPAGMRSIKMTCCSAFTSSHVSSAREKNYVNKKSERDKGERKTSRRVDEQASGIVWRAKTGSFPSWPQRTQHARWIISNYSRAICAREKVDVSTPAEGASFARALSALVRSRDAGWKAEGEMDGGRKRVRWRRRRAARHTRVTMYTRGDVLHT